MPLPVRCCHSNFEANRRKMEQKEEQKRRQEELRDAKLRAEREQKEKERQEICFQWSPFMSFPRLLLNFRFEDLKHRFKASLLPLAGTTTGSWAKDYWSPWTRKAAAFGRGKPPTWVAEENGGRWCEGAHAKAVFLCLLYIYISIHCTFVRTLCITVYLKK